MVKDRPCVVVVAMCRIAYLACRADLYGLNSILLMTEALIFFVFPFGMP